MSSLDPSWLERCGRRSRGSWRRSLPKLAVVAGLALGLAACFRPLYGPTASGARLPEVMAAIEVEPVATGLNQERLGHYLRSELIFDLDGSGEPQPKRFKLFTTVTQSLQTPIVDTATGRAVSATLTADVRYTVKTFDGSQTLVEGTATASATYDRTAQRFATVRAARDAEIRVAKTLADQIRTRIAAVLSAKS